MLEAICFYLSCLLVLFVLTITFAAAISTVLNGVRSANAVLLNNVIGVPFGFKILTTSCPSLTVLLERAARTKSFPNSPAFGSRSLYTHLYVYYSKYTNSQFSESVTFDARAPSCGRLG
ncbi:Transmembrane protein [Trichinella spiralis]|uniref:Transmembrane protein n=1 Tax=Trichinella spiralis TaxID=6334 RepID=A0ABR3KNV2_TRISP